ncbi:MAG: aminotransferase class I/II-fold pyridoxal phosphate-dependent enzyme [Rikenellaceae bacterium]
MRYDFENAADRTGCSAIKINKERIHDALGLNYYPDSISMWIADMDFVCAPEIVEAIAVRVARATFGYSGVAESYFNSLSSWYKTRLGMQFRAEEVLFSNGTLSALRDIIRALTTEGEGIIIQPPVYYPFANITRECKRKVVENHLCKDAENRYSIDFEDFELKCQDPANTMFILCNPHNPIGQIWSREDVERMLAICKANNVIFFSDEVHADIVRAHAKFTSTLNLDSAKGVIVATAANKTFNLAGLHITNIIIPDENLRQRINAYRGMVHISPIAEAASTAAYSQCGEWADEMNRVIDQNVLYMSEFLKTHMPKVRFNPASATYLMWVDFSAYGIDERELLTLLADKAHVILEGGTMFSTTAEGFVRMNVACPKSILVEALDRIKRVLE